MKKNELPAGYHSWLQFIAENKEQIEENIKRNIMPQNSFLGKEREIDGEDPQPHVRVYEIDYDYAKARAFEELGRIPSSYEVHRAYMCLIGGVVSHPEIFRPVREFLQNIFVKTIER